MGVQNWEVMANQQQWVCSTTTVSNGGGRGSWVQCLNGHLLSAHVTMVYPMVGGGLFFSVCSWQVVVALLQGNRSSRNVHGRTTARNNNNRYRQKV